MHSCFGGKTVVFKGTVDECNEFRHIIVAISLFCIVRRIGKVLIKLNDGNKIPAIGFGVFTIPNDGPTYERQP